MKRAALVFGDPSGWSVWSWMPAGCVPMVWVGVAVNGVQRHVLRDERLCEMSQGDFHLVANLSTWEELPGVTGYRRLVVGDRWTGIAVWAESETEMAQGLAIPEIEQWPIVGAYQSRTRSSSV